MNMKRHFSSLKHNVNAPLIDHVFYVRHRPRMCLIASVSVSQEVVISSGYDPWKQHV
jgi:hypothetical protein